MDDIKKIAEELAEAEKINIRLNNNIFKAHIALRYLCSKMNDGRYDNVLSDLSNEDLTNEFFELEHIERYGYRTDQKKATQEETEAFWDKVTRFIATDIVKREHRINKLDGVH